MHLLRTGRLAVPAFAGLLALTACADGTGPGNAAKGTVQLSFAGSTAASGPSFDRLEEKGGSATSAVSAVKIEKVELVLAKVKLERAQEEQDCDDDEARGGGACELFRNGPVLLSLPLDGGAVTPFATRPPAGTYDRLEFKIHRPEGNDSATKAFFAEHAAWPARASLHVTGTVTTSGATPQTVPFESYFSTEAKIRQQFDPPLVVTDATDASALSVKVAVNVGSWFRTADGGYLDPRELTTSRQLLERVEKNIRDSFRAEHEKGGENEKDQGKGKDKGKGKGNG